MGVIQAYLKHHPQKNKLKNKKHNVHFLVHMDSEPINKSGDITKILTKIFGRNIGSSMLRNIYLSSKYSGMMKDLKKRYSRYGDKRRRGNEHIYQELNHSLPLVIYD
jgi:hypothetical protein